MSNDLYTTGAMVVGSLLAVGAVAELRKRGGASSGPKPGETYVVKWDDAGLGSFRRGGSKSTVSGPRALVVALEQQGLHVDSHREGCTVSLLRGDEAVAQADLSWPRGFPQAEGDGRSLRVEELWGSREVRGSGGRLMKMLLAATDAAEITVSLVPLPLAVDESDPDFHDALEALCDFYSTLGFVGWCDGVEKWMRPPMRIQR